MKSTISQSKTFNCFGQNCGMSTVALISSVAAHYQVLNLAFFSEAEVALKEQILNGMSCAISPYS